MSKKDIVIDGRTFQIDALSEEARRQIAAVRATDLRIAQLQQDLAIAQTARNAYAQALKASLPA